MSFHTRLFVIETERLSKKENGLLNFDKFPRDSIRPMKVLAGFMRVRVRQSQYI